MWRQPQGRAKPRRRFLKNRRERGPTIAEYMDEWDRSWHEYDFLTWDDECEYKDLHAVLARIELDASIERLLSPTCPLFGTPSGKSRVMPSELKGFLPDELTQELWQHQATLDGRPAKGGISRLWQVLSEPGVPEALSRIKARFQNSTMISWACKFAPFWIRSPVDFQGDDFRSLIDHLLVRYRPPEFLYHEWSRKEPHFKWLCWFIMLSQGGDLKQAAERFGWVVPRRLIQYLYEAPRSLQPTAACVFAEVRRRGGAEIDALRLLRNPAFVMDPTEPGYVAHSRFWRETVGWLIEHRKQLSDVDADQVLSWSMHEFTEAVHSQETFTILGRSPRACLERCRIYHEQLLRPWAQFRWNPHRWDWMLVDFDEASWSFEELTSGQQLFEEGQALRHCVASYAARCAAGYSAIVALKRDGERCLTIEIDPRKRTLSQARGFCNREADKVERAVIGQWLVGTVRKS